ncbi:hypothetical protein COO60DRAFT_211539 [Scenedesmus sp. NREL 46B-D3]|nr:hypothetical protein COO60DRAFT_211539 [Scenedesmus sp. NREL 46B-D3]
MWRCQLAALAHTCRLLCAAALGLCFGMRAWCLRLLATQQCVCVCSCVCARPSAPVVARPCLLPVICSQCACVCQACDNDGSM